MFEPHKFYSVIILTAFFSTSSPANAQINIDTDGDMIFDDVDVDDDNDGIPDVLEGVELVSFDSNNASVVSGSTDSGLNVTATFSGELPDTIEAAGLTDRIDNDNFTFLTDITQLRDTSISFSNTEINNLPTDLTFNFTNGNVQEVYFHFNSLDQISLVFNPTADIGFELLSFVAGVNADASGGLRIENADPDTRDTSASDESLDDFGAGSVDGTVRFFSLTSTPITTLELEIIEFAGRTTNVRDGWQFGVEVVLDTDGDGLSDRLDLDSDNDGIPDNVEAQLTADGSYIAPVGTYDSTGLDDAYTGIGGLTPVNTIPTTPADFINTDSDSEGDNDTVEAGLTLDGTVGDNGLDDAIDENGNEDSYDDVNGTLNVPSSLPDANNDDVPDFRDISPPSDLQIDNANTDSVVENTASGSVVGILSATDSDTSDTFTYVLIAGVGDEDNGLFTINGDEVVLAFEPDFENPIDSGGTAADNTYSLRVRVTDNAGNTYEETLTINVTDLDEIPPTVAIENVPTNSNSPFTATFEFSEDVSDFELADITVANGTASEFVAVDDNTYTALITPTAEDDVTIDVAAAVATDAFGNDNTAATQAVSTFNSTPPVVDIQNVPASSNAPFTATFEFSNDVSGFDLADITVDNGTASDFVAVDDNTYTALITPTAEGDVTIDVAAAVATDAFGNGNIVAMQALANFDSTPPSIDIQNVPANSNTSFTATFEFSEDVSGFGLADIVVGNGTASGFVAIDDNTYTALITPTAEGEVTIDVAAAVATDTSGNNNTIATQAVSSFNNTTPNAPVITITEDTNNDGEISDDELDGDIDVTVTLPADAAVGDTLTITDGTLVTDLVLTGTDITANEVTSAFPALENGETITVIASITDAIGNTGPEVNDTALINVDADNDGIPNSIEELIGSNPNNSDSDQDGIPDGDEIVDINDPQDSDNDGVPDLIDPDDDNDGIATAEEDFGADDENPSTNPSDRDNDGIANYLDTDSDGDGILDATENGSLLSDIDNDGIVDSLDADDDGVAGVDEGSLDENGDGVEDNLAALDSDNDADANYLDFDSDNDGAPDLVESGRSGVDTDDDGIDDVFDVNVTGGDDINDDGIDDNVLPANDDTDDIANYLDLDSDNDGLPDIFENGSTGNDGDGDGIDDAFDADDDGVQGTDEGNTDTDGDGIDETVTPPDTDNDGNADYLDIDSDSDGISDGLESGISGNDDDNDGIDNSVDADNDGVDGTDTGVIDDNGDGIIDDFVPLNSDDDPLANFRDLDSDNDGLADVLEGGLPDENQDALVDDDSILSANAPDTDGTDGPDFIDVDSDDDGINDIVESGNGDLDSNDDGQVDDVTDADNDGIPDVSDSEPNGFGNQLDTDGDGIPNTTDDDDDNDGILDAIEESSLPTLSGNDTDNDGIDDAFDIDVTGGEDINNDGIDDDLDGDTDNDGLPDSIDQDSDNDGIPDILEAGSNPSVPVDTDNDGTPDYLDTDSDNDGIDDSEEAGNIEALTGVDSDNDGIDDAIDVDITGGDDLDGNGIDDASEPVDTDSDGIPDFSDPDSDGDSIPDLIEGTLDSDDNGIIDALDTDSDNDGIPDALETTSLPALSNLDTDNDGIDDAFDSDITGGMDDNGNGIDDDAEPLDSDGDGIADFVDPDSDNDGIPDSVESSTDIPMSGLDSDNDGIDDLIDPDQTGGLDVNNDGVDDEFAPVDTDNDGTPNYLDIDSDNDGILDAIEADTTSLDSDDDGIDDVFDVDQTGGQDANGDGVDDAVEPTNTDDDSAPDFLDLDSDNDSLLDVIEAGLIDDNADGFSDEGVTTDAPLNTDSDDIADFRDLDSNDNGENDISEFGESMLDSNDDGVIDDVIDEDGDGIADEIDDAVGIFGGSLDTDGDGIANNIDLDDDNDGIPDAIETMSLPSLEGLDENNNGIDDAIDVALTNGRDLNQDGIDDFLSGDTDGDGIIDTLDLDSDNDGIVDTLESGNDQIIDINGDGLIDNLIDDNNDGLDDRVDASIFAVNTDNTDLPDFQDLDSDNDSLTDLSEAGVAQSLDSDNDGQIDEHIDLDFDGISDAVDGDVTGAATSGVIPPVPDTDNDGTVDYRDLDSDGDGFDDALEAGDFNNNGINDNLENGGSLETAVTGAGSTSGMMLLMFGLLVLLKLSQRHMLLVKLTRHSRSNLTGRLYLIALLSVFSTQASAEARYCGVQYDDSFESCWYVGASLGLSLLEPEGEVNGWSTNDKNSRGYGLHLGQHFKPNWFWELAYVDAGEAGLGNRNPALEELIPDAVITYDIPSLMVGYYLLDDKQYGWNLYGKAGVSVISTEANDERIGEEKQSSAQLAFGLGAQYRFDDSPWFINLQFDSFDRDAKFLSLRLSRFLGGPKKSSRSKVVPVAVPVQAPKTSPKPLTPAVLDSDKDGVIDSDDRCPSTRANAPVDSSGCVLFSGVIQGVNFRSNQAVLTQEATQVLNQTLITLQQFPNVRVEVQAHTDSQGADAYNQNLSTQRARAVVDYLTARGISSNRLVPRGYGENRPISDNNTAEGRAQNRRVELSIIN